MGHGYGVREPCGLVARRQSVVQGPGPEAAALPVDRPREARRAAAKTRGVAGCCMRERGSGTERERGGGMKRERGGGTERERGGGMERERDGGTERERGGGTERERGGGTERERGGGTERAAAAAWRGQWWWHGEGGGSGM